MSWWKSAVLYEIYVRSFADSDRDGIGDLEGIIGRLDHLHGAAGSLGVDAVWLTPIHPSPLVDIGYDVADFRAVDPVLGDLATFDRLVAACHARGIRVLMDLVACHTSIEHPWFVASRSSRADRFRDWYVWRDAAPDGGPPTRWTAAFGGPAWTLDPATGQYYLHTFYPEQPQLNWRNPAVGRAMGEVVHFWRDHGVDGFRVDAVNVAVADERLREDPPDVPRYPLPIRQGHYPLWSQDRPENIEVARSLRKAARVVVRATAAPGDAGGAPRAGDAEALLLGEAYVPIERLGRYLGERAGDAFDLVFDFDFLFTSWDADRLRFAVEQAEALLPEHGWPCRALSNHDNPRHATRLGGRALRAAAVLLLTLRGTPVLYMGEEIGMSDVPLRGVPFDRAGRDAARSPMQWDAGPGGGFTTGTPWLPLGDVRAANVATQRDDPTSLLSLYRRLIAERHGSRALGAGTQRCLDTAPGSGVFGYLREAAGDRLLIAIECAGRGQVIDAWTASRGRIPRRGRLRLSTDPSRREGIPLALDRLELAPDEAVVVEL